jgi:hypothetical protein
MRFFSNVIWVPACWLAVLLAGCAQQRARRFRSFLGFRCPQ